MKVKQVATVTASLGLDKIPRQMLGVDGWVSEELVSAGANIADLGSVGEVGEFIWEVKSRAGLE